MELSSYEVIKLWSYQVMELSSYELSSYGVIKL